MPQWGDNRDDTELSSEEYLSRYGLTQYVGTRAKEKKISTALVLWADMEVRRLLTIHMSSGDTSNKEILAELKKFFPGKSVVKSLRVIDVKAFRELLWDLSSIPPLYRAGHLASLGGSLAQAVACREGTQAALYRLHGGDLGISTLHMYQEARNVAYLQISAMRREAGAFDARVFDAAYRVMKDAGREVEAIVSMQSGNMDEEYEAIRMKEQDDFKYIGDILHGSDIAGNEDLLQKVFDKGFISDAEFAEYTEHLRTGAVLPDELRQVLHDVLYSEQAGAGDVSDTPQIIKMRDLIAANS